MRYQFTLLQFGQLPLRPGKRIDRTQEHRCTSALIWPVDAAPTPETAIVTDPCYTLVGCAAARKQADAAGIELNEVRWLFQTHSHLDHAPLFPSGGFPMLEDVAPDDKPILPDLEIWPCPGHAPDLRALVFRDAANRVVCVVGDAVLDREWLEAWGFYWPNMYLPIEVVETWRSLARLLEADLIIPGHGPAIEVTADLLGLLIERFPQAEYHDRCPEVLEALVTRRERLLTST